MATQTRAPTSDEAATGTWSGVAGSRWTLVDDYPDTGGADILTGGTTAAVITFGFSAFSIPAGSTGISVQVMYYDGEATTGANNCGGRVKVGGSYFNAATHNPAGTTYTSRSDNWATNPKTAAAWTVDDVNGVGVNALQAFGMNSTDSSPTWRFSSIQVQVTYTAPSSSGDASTSSTAQSSAVTSAVLVSGSAGSATGSQTTAMVGSVAINASGATAATAQTSSASGDVTESSGDVTGTAATSSAGQISAAAGSARVSGGANTQSSDSTVAAAGAVRVGGAATSSSKTPTNAASGAVRITGTGVSAAASQSSSAYQSAPAAPQHDHGWCINERNRRARMGRRR